MLEGGRAEERVSSNASVAVQKHRDNLSHGGTLIGEEEEGREERKHLLICQRREQGVRRLETLTASEDLYGQKRNTKIPKEVSLYLGSSKLA